MVALLTASRLSDDEKVLMSRLNASFALGRSIDERLDAYYEGSRRLEQIGLAVPPELRRFETMVNWTRTVVDEPERRLDIKAIIMPGEETASKLMREPWEANNLDSEAPLMHKETLILGRGFVSVGTNEDDPQHPLITVEPPRQMVAAVESRRRRMLGCLRQYRDWDDKRRRTLLLPNSTIWLVGGRNGWEIEDRDDHNLGRVPVVMFLNRRRAGKWWGTSEMADVIPFVDAGARALTNLQLATETLAVPGRFIFGVDPSKMVDPKTGKPIPTWEAYYTALMVHANKDAKAGQFTAANLSNFTEVVNHYGQLVASMSGLPSRYFVNSTVNPAAEGAIRADESRLVKNVERKATDWGDGWGWVAGLYERFRTGEWMAGGDRVHTEWHDAGTPTFAQKADAVQKLSGGTALMSRHGAWDELGWSEARKDREDGYFAAEAEDPYVTALAAKDAAARDSAAAKVAAVTDGPVPSPAPVG